MIETNGNRQRRCHVALVLGECAQLAGLMNNARGKVTFYKMEQKLPSGSEMLAKCGETSQGKVLTAPWKSR